MGEHCADNSWVTSYFLSCYLFPPLSFSSKQKQRRRKHEERKKGKKITCSQYLWLIYVSSAILSCDNFFILYLKGVKGRKVNGGVGRETKWMWEKVPVCGINHAHSFCKYTSSHFKFLTLWQIDWLTYILIAMLVTAKKWRFRGSESCAYCSQTFMKGDSPGEILFAVTSVVDIMLGCICLLTSMELIQQFYSLLY